MAAAAWAGRAQWRILDTDFDRGLQFLAAWQAWQADPQRPRILHYVALAATAPTSSDLQLAAAANTALQPLAQALAAQWQGLLPGVHRLAFAQGHVLLTLCLGPADRMLRQLDFQADAVVLHGVSLQDGAPHAADAVHPKALARCCRRGTAIAVHDDDGTLAGVLRPHGFAWHDSQGGWLHGDYAPAWEPRGRVPNAPVDPTDCIVIGAGLAGAAAAASLARRGWAVCVLDAAPQPAAGASSLPAGVLVPHGSPDDNLLSRLSRDGVRATLQQARQLLVEGRDFAVSGVLEHHVDGAPARPPAQSEAAASWSRPADAGQKRAAGLDSAAHADWHTNAAWIRPAALVQAWLAQPGIVLRCGAQVSSLVQADGLWQARDASGDLLARGQLVVVAAACGSQQLAPGLALQPVRGQVTWAVPATGLELPPFPVNGDGSFIPSVPTPQGAAWLCGASFERGETDLAPRAADQRGNLARLQRLLPAIAARIAAGSGPLQAWTGIRCASTDRRPLVGPLAGGASGLWLSTAMGSRGLTFAALAGELIAAHLHGEPLPVARKLAAALHPDRGKKAPATRAGTGAYAYPDMP
jgi:tRNA 5-methylaminomethyl-2-thiouridine biosynthesis bifunctional protein